jgi:hypothetical protein
VWRRRAWAWPGPAGSRREPQPAGARRPQGRAPPAHRRPPPSRSTT